MPRRPHRVDTRRPARPFAGCLATAARRILAQGVGALGVYAGDRLIGIISDHDLVRALAEGADPHTAPVDAYATWGVHTTSLSEDAATVARRMRDLAIRRMPVVKGRTVVGMVSISDLLAAQATPANGDENEPAQRA